MARRTLHRARWVPAVLCAALLLSAAIPARAQEPPPVPAPPPVPEAPPPPSPPLGTTAIAGSFEVAKGDVHKGNAYLITPSVRVDGTLDGDLFALAATATISGKVLGDVGFVGRSFEFDGYADDAVRIWAADVRIDGLVDGELIASGGRVRIGPKSVIRGDARLYASEIIVEGNVERDLTAAGGVVRLLGKIGGDSSITCDLLEVGPDARVRGDLDYQARRKLDDAVLAPIVGGTVRFGEKGGKTVDVDVDFENGRSMAEKARVVHEEKGSRGFGTKIFAFFAALVVGLLALRTFRAAAPAVTDYVGSDPLKSLGVGFLTILSGIAAVFAAILIVTIPLVLIYWLLLLIAFYLGKIPVAVWVGRFGLGRIGRASASDGWAFVAGLFGLYLIYALPVVGTWIWFLTSLLGLGAIVLGARDHRLARRTPAPAAPAAPPPVAEAGTGPVTG
jgi:hypothetical protein